MIRVLVADDHVLIREGLSKVFGREPDIEVVASAEDADQAVERALSGDIDVAILDVNMPGPSGLEALKRIHGQRPGLPVLMLSMLPERDFALRMLRAGASGFVSKESAAAEIVDAVRHVAAGGRFLSAGMVEHLAAELEQPRDTLPHEALSNREFQVLQMIASGRGTRQIAENLGLSVNTIATYRRRILKKLALRSDVDVTRYAMRHDLLQ